MPKTTDPTSPRAGFPWLCAFALILLGWTAPPSLAAGTQDLEWEPLSPERFSSSDGSEGELLEDGSVRFEGKPDERATLELVFDGDFEGVSAIRLEALTDPELPFDGPGRGIEGVFRLTDLTLSVGPARSGARLDDAVLLEAVAFDDVEGGPPRNAIDGSLQTAWGPTLGGTSVSAAFLLDAPLPDKRSDRLRLRLGHATGESAALGRVRLSVTRGNDVRAALGLDQAEAELTVQVRDAIAAGVARLLKEQQLDGSWRFQQNHYPSGSTALAAYTLMRCGLPPTHPSVERAIRFLLANPPRKTYSTSVQLMALGLHGGKRHADAIEERAEALLDWQTNGGWNYPGSHGDPGAGGHPPDLSLTQYALLGLRSAHKTGFEVPVKAWRSAKRFVLRRQERSSGYAPAGFSYADGRDVTGSMTAAGLASLGIIAEMTEDDSRDMTGAIEKGLAWVEEYFTVSRNPRPSVGQETHGEDKWWLYYLYGLERVGGVLDLDAFGPHRWYERGAVQLVESQRDDGTWYPPHNGEGAQEVPDTCFALLFLTRATRRVGTGESDPSRRLPTIATGDQGLEVYAVGDGPFRIWIPNLGQALLDDFGDPDVGLSVVEARWEELDAVGDPLGDVAVIEVDPEQDSRYARLTAQVEFDTPGTRRVRPVVTVVDPDDERTTIVGPPVELVQTYAAHDELVGYADDGAANLLRGFELEELSVSSKLNDTWHGGRAVDGRQVYGWCAQDDDPEPTIRLDLGRGLRADRLVLSPNQEPWSADPWRTGQAGRIAITINGSVELEAECRPGGWHKTVVELGKPRRIRELEIRVLSRTDVHPEHPEMAGVGFAEIELMLGG